MKNQKALIEALVRNEQLYGICLEENDCGPMDGCCYALARALQQTIGGELYTIVGNMWSVPGNPIQGQHIILKKDGMFWDGDGCQSKKQLEDTWRTYEHLDNFFLRPFKNTDCPNSPRSERLVCRLTDHFEDAMKQQAETEDDPGAGSRM